MSEEKITPEENENLSIEFSSLNVDGFEYQTILNTKYKNREAYKEEDLTKVVAFISGTIDDIFVKKGKSVEEGQPLLILEAMKMKNNIQAPMSGKIREILVKKGDKVIKGQLLIEME